MSRVTTWLCNADRASRLTAAGCKNYLINALGVSPSVVPPSPIPGGVFTSSMAMPDFSSCVSPHQQQVHQLVTLPLTAGSPSQRLRFLNAAAALQNA